MFVSSPAASMASVVLSRDGPSDRQEGGAAGIIEDLELKPESTNDGNEMVEVGRFVFFFMALRFPAVLKEQLRRDLPVKSIFKVGPYKNALATSDDVHVGFWMIPTYSSLRVYQEMEQEQSSATNSSSQVGATRPEVFDSLST